MTDINEIKNLLLERKVRWSAHCLERMNERDISIADVKSCIENGEIIEEYPDDFPYPSCLIFGSGTQERIIHVVAGTDSKYLFIITAYIPNMIKFEADLKTRRR